METKKRKMMDSNWASLDNGAASPLLFGAGRVGTLCIGGGALATINNLGDDMKSYQFDIDEHVITDLGEEGVVTSQLTERMGKKYFVRTKTLETWYMEHELQPTPENATRKQAKLEAKTRAMSMQTIAANEVLGTYPSDIIDTLESQMAAVMIDLSKLNDEALMERYAKCFESAPLNSNPYADAVKLGPDPMSEPDDQREELHE